MSEPTTDAFALPGDLLYLDCAAQSPRLRAALDAGHAALEAMASPWRESADAWEESLEALRARMAACVFAGDVDGLAMMPSVAYAMATAAGNLPLGVGDVVLLEDTPFPSSLLAWQARCTTTAARLLVADAPEGDRTAALLRALHRNDHVRVVVVSRAHWVDGGLLDVDRIADAARDADAALVLDLSQSAGVLPVELARWRPRCVVTVGHKWLLGPAGLGWLWAAPGWRDAGAPIEQHWRARDPAPDWRFTLDPPTPYRRGARRFDAGGIATGPALAMATAGVAQLQAWDVPRIEAALRTRVSQLHVALDDAGLAAWRQPHDCAHFSGLRPPPALLDAASRALRDAGVLCTTRYGVVRIAPHLHVGCADMQRVAGVLATVAGV